MQIADEKALLEEIDARDRFEDAFADAYYLVMGEAIEWSNIYGTGEALYDMRRKLRREGYVDAAETALDASGIIPALRKP